MVVKYELPPKYENETARLMEEIKAKFPEILGVIIILEVPREGKLRETTIVVNSKGDDLGSCPGCVLEGASRFYHNNNNEADDISIMSSTLN